MADHGGRTGVMAAEFRAGLFEPPPDLHDDVPPPLGRGQAPQRVVVRHRSESVSEIVCWRHTASPEKPVTGLA